MAAKPASIMLQAQVSAVPPWAAPPSISNVIAKSLLSGSRSIVIIVGRWPPAATSKPIRRAALIRVSTVSGELRLTAFVSEAVGQLRSRAQAKLAVDAAQVSLDGLWTEEERRGDLAIRGPDGYLERDLQLLLRELLRA